MKDIVINNNVLMSLMASINFNYTLLYENMYVYIFYIFIQFVQYILIAT